MAFDAISNFAYSTVATAPSPATSGTSLVVAAGDGARFPTPPFNATIWPAGSMPLSTNAEIVRVTAISTDTFTITRAQEGSSAQSIAAGYQIAETISALGVTNLQKATYAPGYMCNGKISATVSSNNITIAIKTLAGTDPSASDPVFINIANTVRWVTASLSFTLNAGTNYFNSGGAELAANEIDYFIYLGWNASDSVVVLGMSRIIGFSRADFSQTNTNEKYLAESYTTNAASTDQYNIVGRVAATLSAAASYNWSVPTYTPGNLIQRPIYETRWLTWTPTYSGYSANPTNDVSRYKVFPSEYEILHREGTAGTSNSTNTSLTLPFTTVNLSNYLVSAATTITNNGTSATTPGRGSAGSNTNVLTILRDYTGTSFTTSGGKSASSVSLRIEI